MLSILDEPTVAAPEETARVEESSELLPQSADYEIVLGPAQIACWLFVGVIAIAVCSSLAYLAGKSQTAKKAPVAVSATAPPAPAAQPAAPAPLPAASVVVPPKTDLQTILNTAAKPAKPLFAEPEAGKVYIQMGAVERGMAMILADGLRSHGFDSFVAPGPSDRIFRVLIGPLPDPDSFRQAKAAVDAIDLATFARKYEK